MSGQEKEVRFIDLFAGVGGFHKGFEQANSKYISNNSGRTPQHSRRSFRCVWASEWNKHATTTYKKRFSKTPFCETDIRLVKADDIPEADLLCAGFPCQPFSIAGKRKGFEEARGTLFYEILRIARDKRIPFILLENVKGLLSAQEGEAFRFIITSLAELGYCLQWKVLNSKNFGVPQNRERVFIVGCLGEKRFRQVFPLGENGEVFAGERYKKQGSWQGFQNQVSSTIGKGYGKVRAGGETMIVANAVTPDAYLARGERKRVDGKPVLTSMHERRIRRLTPIECERLQGFPDNWTAGLSDTQRYKCMGNAVTVNVVEAIGRRMIEVELFKEAKK